MKTAKTSILLLSFASLIAIFGALIGQYFFNLHPCSLCLKQRIPHLVVIAVGIVVFLRNNSNIYKTTLVVIALTLLSGTGIALYHVGVEAGMFETSCSMETNPSDTIDEIRAKIMAAPLVSCDQAMAYIFGLSMAAWNAIYSTILALFAFFSLRFCK